MRALLAREARALRHCFHYHRGNSHAQKTIFYAGLALAGALALLQAIGVVDYDHLAPPTKLLMDSAAGVLVYLFGRVHGKEAALLLFADDPPKPAGPASTHTVPATPARDTASPDAQAPPGGGES